jgi:UDP:flavonoid glycosyltransferase YjiC (YdhE family)
MKIVLASLGAYGHLYPMMPLAVACAAAGHEVMVATGPPFLDRLPVPTVRGYPESLGLGSAFAETARRHPGLRGAELALAMFADVASEQVTPTMIDLLREERPDLVVYEGMDVGAGVAAAVVGVPAAAFGISLLPGFVYPAVHGRATQFRRDAWTSRGLTPPDEPLLLGAALLDPTPASLLPADDPLVGLRVPVRTTPWSEATGLPGWLSSPAERPRVYLTLGTVSFGAVEVLRRALAGIAALDVDVLVAVGPEGDPGLLGPQPATVHAERFVDQPAVLAAVDVVVHHGGTGTALAALAAGRPQLLLPQGADHFVNADLLGGTGAARALLGDAQQADAIGDAVRALLGAGPERDRSEALAAEIAAMPAPEDLVGRLTALARG